MEKKYLKKKTLKICKNNPAQESIHYILKEI